MKKSCRKCAPKGSPRLFLILVNNPKQPLQSPGTSDQSLFRIEAKFRKIPVLVLY